MNLCRLDMGENTERQPAKMYNNSIGGCFWVYVVAGLPFVIVSIVRGGTM